MQLDSQISTTGVSMDLHHAGNCIWYNVIKTRVWYPSARTHAFLI